MSLVQLSRNISTCLIRGYFLALMVVLSPFGFYEPGSQQLSETQRIELVEKDHEVATAIPVIQSVAIDLPDQTLDYHLTLIHQEHLYRQSLKRAATYYTKAPPYPRKTTHSTSSEDEPLSIPTLA